MTVTRENKSSLEQTCPSAPMSMTNTMWMGSNLGLSGDRLATNCSGTAYETRTGTAQSV